MGYDNEKLSEQVKKIKTESNYNCNKINWIKNATTDCKHLKQLAISKEEAGAVQKRNELDKRSR